MWGVPLVQSEFQMLSFVIVRRAHCLLIRFTSHRASLRFQKKAEEIKAVSMQSAMETVKKVCYIAGP